VSKYVPPNYVDGSFHWSYERATAAALIPLFTTQLMYGAHPVLDGVLGLVLPLHLHIGFDACVTDYFPARRFPRANKYLDWGLKATTAAVIWGCFEFNTNDVGLTELIMRTWTA
jgi:succinate dehydrogenase (ubiquinone) membrane anchor subunit